MDRSRNTVGDITTKQVAGWARELEVVGERIGPLFVRSEPRRRAVAYVRGLLGDAERKNGWQLAEEIGESTPDGVQHLLARATWDADAVRDDLIRYASSHLADSQGVLIVDETGFLKKGTRSVGVARQYSGTAGRIENAQIGVFLGYATRKGQTLIDRALYLPRVWIEDQERRAAAGVPQEVTFATKLVLARRMIARALDAGVPAAWVTGDAVYGSDFAFRKSIEDRGLGYVLAVRSDQMVWIGTRQVRVPAVLAVLAVLPASIWRRRSCGAGSKGPRHYDWALCQINAPEPERYGRWLLLRRSVEDPTEVAYFLCGGAPETSLRELVRVAGRRWAIEECFELAKGDCGLDEYEVRSWTGWHRHVTLSLFALAILTAIHVRLSRRRGSTRRGSTRRGSTRRGSTRRGSPGRVRTGGGTEKKGAPA